MESQAMIHFSHKALLLPMATGTFLLFVFGTSMANDEGFLRPQPTPAWIVEESKCARQYKNMEKLLALWAKGAPEPDTAERVDREYWQGRVPFWAYKEQYIAMRESFGDLYFYGCANAGKPADKQTAFVMYERSAVNHSPSAQFKLGKMLREGDGVQKNEGAGLAWISSAALEGSKEAAIYLAQNGIEAPQPIWPNSYAVAATESKAIFDGNRRAERAEIVRDLGNLAIGATAAYLGYRAATLNAGAITQTKQTPKSSYSPAPLTARPTIMARPTYCNYQGNIMNHSGGNTAYFYVTAFCN